MRLAEVQDIAAAAARAGTSVPAGGGTADRLRELVRVCALVRGVLLREARPRPGGGRSFGRLSFSLSFSRAGVHVFVRVFMSLCTRQDGAFTDAMVEFRAAAEGGCARAP